MATIDELQERSTIEYFLKKQAAETYNRDKFDQDQRKNEFGSKIKTVNEEMKNRLLSIIREGVDSRDSVKNILREQKNIYDEELSRATDKEVKKQIKQNIQKLYKNERYKLNRIIRTEAMNSAMRALLLRMKKQGIKEVKLMTSRDVNVCAKCRNLESNNTIWRVDKLLSLGHYPLSNITHPQCRCVFTPVIEDVTLGNNVGRIKNVPRNETKNIQDLTKEIGFKADVEIVRDLVNHPKFIEMRTNYYIKKGESPDKAKTLAENDKIRMKGKLSQFTIGKGEDKKTYIDKNVEKVNSWTHILSKIHAKRFWQREEPKFLQKTIQKLYDRRVHERTDNHKAFFSGKAKVTPMDYFIEGYAHYLTHPEILKELDPELYDYLKEAVFKGKEYMNRQF